MDEDRLQKVLVGSDLRIINERRSFNIREESRTLYNIIDGDKV